MLTFTDPLKYVMGIGTAYATSLTDGSVVFWSNKYQEGNTTFSASEMVNNGGIGNGPAIILYNDPNISVAFTAADYNEFVRSAATGANLSYGAPVETCQTVTATGTTLSLDVTSVTPVAGPGMSKVYAYVQEIGAASPVSVGGVAYEVNPTSGAISGFTATNGKQYLVTFYTMQANARITTYNSDFNGDVVRFVYRRPIYTNFNASTNQGDLYGWQIDVIPYLKLNPSSATTNGSQTSFSTTGINGRAIVYDDAVISGGCDDCTLVGAPLMYSIIAPCDTNAGMQGIIGALGSEITVAAGNTYQLAPGVVVYDKLNYNVPADQFTYSSAATGVATVGSNTGLVAGVSSGTAVITVSYSPDGVTTYTDFVTVNVTSG